MGRSKQTDEVKVTTGEGKITLTIGADTVKLGSNPSEHKLPAQRLEHTLSKLQDAESAAAGFAVAIVNVLEVGIANMPKADAWEAAK